MRHPTLCAFAVVLLLAAPGAYRELCAEGGAAPAPTRVVTVGDARLAVTLDRTQVHPGETVTVAMSLENPGPRERAVAVEIAVLERVGSPMARVLPPPQVRHTERVTMVARAHDVTKRAVTLTVPAARGPARGPARGLGRTFMARVTATGAPGAATLAFVALPTPAPAPAAVAATPPRPQPLRATPPTPRRAATVPAPAAVTAL